MSFLSRPARNDYLLWNLALGKLAPRFLGRIMRNDLLAHDASGLNAMYGDPMLSHVASDTFARECHGDCSAATAGARARNERSFPG
jgi:hypothetical protein